MAEFRKNITWTNEVGQLKGHHYLQTAMTKKGRQFFFQAEDGIRDFCLSRGLGDVYKRQLARSCDEERRPVVVSLVAYFFGPPCM